MLRLSFFVVSASRIPWPFDWTTLSTFAFPGDAPRFMTPSEEQHFSQFSMMLIWGLNATCLNRTTGALYAPDCYSSVMYCDKNNKEAQPFVRNMETSLQEQGRRLKAARASYFPVLGYIEGMSIQQTYANQMALVDNNSSALLSIKSKGLVDCFTWGECNWQGVEFRQYDLRQAAVVDYYANVVIGGLINNPGLDGSFVDVCVGRPYCIHKPTQPPPPRRIYLSHALNPLPLPAGLISGSTFAGAGAAPRRRRATSPRRRWRAWTRRWAPPRRWAKCSQFPATPASTSSPSTTTRSWTSC